MPVSDAEINTIIKEIDYHGNGKINYTEFLAATIDIDSIVTDCRLKVIFNLFDTDFSGNITAENIIYAMQKLGKIISSAQAEETIAKHDTAGCGCLTFE